MSSPILDRAQLATAHRIVVKIGSSSLTRPDGRLNVPALRKLVDVLAEQVQHGKQIVLVSSGAVAAGFVPLGLQQRPNDLATAQAAAAVGQTNLMACYNDAFAAYELTTGQILLTAADTVRRHRYFHVVQVFERMLELGAIPIVNENDALATSEFRFGDNDRLAALVAQIVQADALVLLTDVNGLFTAPPTTPGAERIPVIHDVRQIAGVTVTGRGSSFGTGGMITKLQSAEMATVSGIPVMLTTASNIAAAFAGDDVGTWFVPAASRARRRKMWLEHAAGLTGRLLVDAGAERAVRERGASLLAAGIRDVQGEFAAGDPVEIAADGGDVFAHGIVAYASTELPRMLGRSTEQMRAELGEDYTRSVVHRDDLALVNSTVTELRGGNSAPAPGAS